MKFLLGTKIGMTSVIDENGKVTPVTVIQAGPCTVTQLRTPEKDGYAAVQIGFGTRRASQINKAETGHMAASGTSARTLMECRVAPDALSSHAVGNVVDVSAFEKGDKVKVSGLIRGRGFTGPVKRYGFVGSPATHGHPDNRRVGSIGSTFPQRTIKGMRMAGKYGNSRKSIINLTVVDTDLEKNLILVKGSVPGVKGRLLEVYGS